MLCACRSMMAVTAVRVLTRQLAGARSALMPSLSRFVTLGLMPQSGIRATCSSTFLRFLKISTFQATMTEVRMSQFLCIKSLDKHISTQIDPCIGQTARWSKALPLDVSTSFCKLSCPCSEICNHQQHILYDLCHRFPGMPHSCCLF